MRIPMCFICFIYSIFMQESNLFKEQYVDAKDDSLNKTSGDIKSYKEIGIKEPSLILIKFAN